MNRKAKFIQIATSVSEPADGTATENLYALDEDGRVWFYEFMQKDTYKVDWVLLRDELSGRHEETTTSGKQ